MVKRRWEGTWTAYSAAGWAFTFAAMNVHWELGGRFGFWHADGQMDRLFDDPTFVAINRAAVGLKIIAGLIALATVHRWGDVVPRRSVLFLIWAVSGIMVLHAVAGFLEGALVIGNVIDWDPALGNEADFLRWNILFWESWWLVGGIVFGIAARTYRLKSPPQPSERG